MGTESDRNQRLKQAAHLTLEQRIPLRPERLRNKEVNKPGFGSHVMLRPVDEIQEL